MSFLTYHRKPAAIRAPPGKIRQGKDQSSQNNRRNRRAHCQPGRNSKGQNQDSSKPNSNGVQPPPNGPSPLPFLSL